MESNLVGRAVPVLPPSSRQSRWRPNPATDLARRASHRRRRLDREKRGRNDKQGSGDAQQPTSHGVHIYFRPLRPPAEVKVNAVCVYSSLPPTPNR